jgi:hypothetical protein
MALATAMGAEPEVTGDAKPKRQTRRCPECGAGRHTAASTCSLAKRGPSTGSGTRSRIDVAPKRKPPIAPQKVAQNVGICIVLLQGAVMQVRPDWAEDQLTPGELGELSYALTDELMSHERIVAWINKAAGAGVHIKLAMVCASIALPRMARRGLLPVGIAEAMIGGMAEENQPPVAETPVHNSPWRVVDGIGETDAPPVRIAPDPED